MLDPRFCGLLKVLAGVVPSGAAAVDGAGGSWLVLEWSGVDVVAVLGFCGLHKVLAAGLVAIGAAAVDGAGGS